MIAMSVLIATILGVTYNVLIVTKEKENNYII